MAVTSSGFMGLSHAAPTQTSKRFSLGMELALVSNEKVIADGGYNHNRCKHPAELNETEGKQCGILRARHETVNRRLKQFFVLGHRFKHNVTLHSVCFHAVANVTQLLIESGHPLFKL